MKYYIIPIFIPHYGCTHQCIFCNQRKITGQQTPITGNEVSTIIQMHLDRITKTRRIEVAFYGGSFTALPIHIQSELLTPAYRVLQQGNIHAIRISTRPDCIDPRILENLLRFGVSTIELGVQSLDNEVLESSGRGHQNKDVYHAVKLIKERDIQCGIQLMPGLPQEDWWSLLATAQQVIELKPNFVRIYPTLVITETVLANLYRQGLYVPLSLEEAIVRSAFLKIIFERNRIKVIRVGLQATTELSDKNVVLAGPFHPAFGEMVDSYFFYLMLSQFMENSLLLRPRITKLIIHHHPKDHSKVRGISNCNIKMWQEKYGVLELQIVPDGKNLNELVIEDQNICCIVNKSMLLF